jgi:hypothetical protein
LYRIRGDDSKQLGSRIGLHDDFPMPSPVARCDDLTVRDDVHPNRHDAVKHAPKVQFRELPIHHSLQEVGAEFQLPCPPVRSFA